ncbi:2'-5' RNA ligase family protein [Clostridium fermenticellae]|uniref:2'-5' RNA ligase family protein n=1 Tax=Clostridium fermenticellae TaxID=2068654 RepID=A0A386H6G4_9CLOT|nr:2'-5' RNA ligase family protein [Clostridium fermenticellae]AYD41309.1 2'-5' RNA ligase family protein [Clostridium fermenticellae]
MKYYLVALFDKDSCSNMEKVQRNICRKYKLYKNIHMPHIVMEVLEDPDIDKVSGIIADILQPYKKFKVEINNDLSFNANFKIVDIKVESKGYIIRLARQINEMLRLYKFNIKENNFDNCNLYIPLVRANFGLREWNNKEYIAACENVKRNEIKHVIKIDKMELWKNVNNKKSTVVKTFKLRDF